MANIYKHYVAYQLLADVCAQKASSQQSTRDPDERRRGDD